MKAIIVAFLALTAIAQQPPLPTQPQIAGIIISANSEQRENAQIAQDKAKNTPVKQFAMTVLNERKAANRQAGDLAERLHIKPEENETTRAIKKLTKKTRSKLKRLKGDAFDRAYINGEVELHQMLLDTMNNALIPGAQNRHLRSLLVNDRTLIEARLNQAREIQSKIK